MFPGGLEEGVEGGELFDGIRRFLGERYVVCERYVVAGEQNVLGEGYGWAETVRSVV